MRMPPEDMMRPAWYFLILWYGPPDGGSPDTMTHNSLAGVAHDLFWPSAGGAHAILQIWVQALLRSTARHDDP
jgi:hypothetical protein